MIISFFEEFPTEENLNKIDLIKFPSKLYIASTSVKDFNKIKRSITSKHIKEIIYWPLLSYNEGYWFSPFSKREALLRTMEEVKGMNFMWDAEIPKKRSLLLTNCCQFFRNKSLIRKFFRGHKGQIYTAEYFPEKGIAALILKALGLTFNPNKYHNKTIKMVYSSMHDHGEPFIRREAKYGVKEYGPNILIALGTIAIGILGNEPILEPKKLARDLRICKESGIQEVVIFRLGGLKKEYLDVIREFI